MKNILWTLLMACALISCKEDTTNASQQTSEVSNEPIQLSAVEQLVTNVEQAHQKDQFAKKEVVKFDIDLSFGGQDRLDGTIFMSTDSRYVRIDKANGTSLIYDGSKVWMSPKDASDQGARFDMFTWSYFFALPFKLSDDGTMLNLSPETDAYEVLRLTFESGTGDAPDDWYDIYIDKQSHLMNHAGYIVTYGGTPAHKAAENAHAIAYRDYQEVEDIPMATSWKFYNYGKTIDLSKVIGEATISNIQFIPMNETLFEKTENSKEITL